VNGLSTSLPADVQDQFLRTVPGLERARITQAGYAIEYDYFPPHQLRHTLELREVPGLFFAGQVNGTTGYEEAAGQGLVAGANAAAKVLGRPPFLLERDQAYIGVLVDDLVTKMVDEPYRLFTSRAEFRLLLRQDNAVERLGPVAREWGLLTETQERALEDRSQQRRRVVDWFKETTLGPDVVRPLLTDEARATFMDSVRAEDLLRRPDMDAADLAAAGNAPFLGSTELLRGVEVEVKYEGYVRLERERAGRLREQAEFELPATAPFMEFVTLSREAREKLTRIRPSNLAQAGRIAGVSPADLQNLILEIKRWRKAVTKDAGESEAFAETEKLQHT